MQIHIIEENGRRIRIPLPLLLLNRTTAGLAAHLIQKDGQVPLTARDIHKLFRCLRQCRKDFPKLVLVEVEGKNGEEVRVML